MSDDVEGYVMDDADRTRLRALCEAATPGPECTGISARWCPRCGDCTCPDGTPADSPLCPLHARSSAHGEDEEHSPDTAVLLRLGDEARTALPALLDDSERLATAERERDEARAGRALAEELACAIGVERDILRRERDEARAEVERLRRELAETRGDFVQMREDRDALKGALSRANELRIGDRAEARLDEREACAVICDVLGDAAEVERDACCDDRSRSLHAGRMHGADECARAIRARGAGGGE